MSFKADIPTLSANEVYTLTFEYEGTETIQLIVGDLTLETTDRRVVFTTTSPVNYIESNVNLTNLNLYEGYYESDDFGGEYTQESYIEGMSLVNLIQSEKHLDFQNNSCGKTTYEDNMIKLTITDVSSLTSTWQHGWIKTSANLKVGATYTCVVRVVENTISTEGVRIHSSYGTLVHGSDNNLLGSGETGVVVFTYTTATATLKDYNGYYDGFCRVNHVGDWQNGSLKYGIMVFEGDYYDYFINSDIPHFEGIGYVKSPKIVSRNEDGTEESIITTPDDLELYDGYDKSGNWYGDKLDLITGTFYQYYDMWDLATLLSQGWPNTAFGYNSDTNTVYVQYNISGTHPSGTVWNGISGYTSALIGNYFEYGYGNANYQQKTSPYIAFLNKYLYISGMSYDEIFNGVTITDNKLDKGGATTALIQFASNNKLKIGLPLNTPITEQLSLNPLKSYRNGSIQTSSQQLTPTLKTTLPVSNKFTTTNLTSGSTYNVYFDGTATKLDAGGTVITNPVSPCEVECGGTTLTIEGTDIQNVRVIETTVKNEVGSICGTTDVELSRITTKCELYNYFDDIVISQNIATKTEIDYEVSKMIVTPTAHTVACNISQAITLSGTYKFHCKVKMQSLTDKYKFMFSNTDMNTNDVTPTNLVEEINLVTYINVSTQAYFYALYADNPVEYYDISLIKLSDEDITGTDTSSINYSQVISDLEQPIKLRSLGTTYDSYNPVTGELIKRIGVSETDGSYSVLSNPIVNKIYNYETITNLLSMDELTSNNATYAIPISTKPTAITLIALNKTVDKCPRASLYNSSTNGWVTNVDLKFDGDRTYYTAPTGQYVASLVFFCNGASDIYSYSSIDQFLEQKIICIDGVYENQVSEYFEGSMENKLNIPIPHLYTNGQVRVYSDSEVYPTTILNGQSTNNYEINELNTSNNYTIRYEGECESINLAKKSNTQGHNVLVKAGATSGNLTFVNDNGDINNVLLVQNDVREQEINHFTGLQTVEVSRILIENQNQSQYVDLPQPVQLNSLPDGTCDTYNPITGEYVQNVGYTDSTDYDTYYQLVNPIITQLTPINISTFEGGILQLITTGGKIFPMVEYSMPTNNRYDTSSWEAGKVYTQRNMTEAYFNESTTPMTPTETMTLTTDHISSGSIILNDNGNGLIVLKGNYTGRDIPYFTGMRSVEAIEVETTPSPDQPLFGKGGRK